METRAPLTTGKGAFYSLCLVCSLCLNGCGGSTNSAKPESQVKGPPPTLEDLLPLKDKTVSSFATQSDLGDEGILMLEIFRPRHDLAELKIAGRVQRLHVTERRVAHASGGILLQPPLTRGATFRGSFGEVTITEVNASFTVPAGTYHGCLTTVEESLRPPKRSTTVFCPKVGLTHMVVESFGEESGRLETNLTHHGERVDLRNGSFD